MIKKIESVFFNLKKWIKMAPVIALVLFVSCQKYNVNDGKNEQEELLIKLESEIASIQFDQLKSGTIEYLSNMDKYSSYAKGLYNVLNESIINKNNKKNEKLNIADYKDLLNIYPKPVCFESPTTDFERSIYKTTIQSLKNKKTSESLIILNVTEGFISNNICNQNQQEKLFYFTAALRQSYFNKLERSSLIDLNATLKSAKIYALSGAAWDTCWDDCMKNTYDNYNLIDWIQFALDPPLDVAWNTASCAWDCGWE
jgi:hypothetical protein